MAGELIPVGITDPAQIKTILEDFVKSKPTGQAWQDFYAGGAGQTIIEMIAGLGAFDAFHAAMNRREGSIDLAVLDSSVREHAFNRGIFTGPTDTLELVLDLTVDVGQSVTIQVGDLVGRIGDYELYSLESKSATTAAFTLRVAAGFMVTETRQIDPKAFSRWVFPTSYQHVASSLERLLIDGEEVSLRSELSFQEKYSNEFMLRRTIDGEIRIYVGNGVLGWLNTSARNLVYSYLAFDDTLQSVLDERPEMILGHLRMSTFTVVRSPVFGIDKEELRGLSYYYPLDGRISQDTDYDAMILKYFAGVLFDVYSFNSDPHQEVQLLVDPSVFVEATHIPRVTDLVDSKRAAGIDVNYHIVLPTTGTIVELVFRVDNYTFYLATREAVLAYLNRQTLKFMRTPKTIVAKHLAVELTEKFGLRFYCDVDNEWTFTAMDFVQAFNLQVNV